MIHEVAELAGPLVATLHNLAYARIPTVPYSATMVSPQRPAGRAGIGKEAGLAPHPRAELWEHLYLDICPRSLQHEPSRGAPLVQLVRPGQRTPSSLTARPLVDVTLGTVYARSDVFRDIVEGLAGESVDAIVTMGSHGDPTALGTSPDNVRVERFVPQEKILPACSAVITHGGAGSMLGASTFGCPILFVPQGADQFTNAERAVNAGAGLRLLSQEVSPEAIRIGLRRLLDEPSFANNASRISNEIAEMPPPDAAVAPLERLVQSLSI